MDTSDTATPLYEPSLSTITALLINIELQLPHTDIHTLIPTDVIHNIDISSIGLFKYRYKRGVPNHWTTGLLDS